MSLHSECWWLAARLLRKNSSVNSCAADPGALVTASICNYSPGSFPVLVNVDLRQKNQKKKTQQGDWWLVLNPSAISVAALLERDYSYSSFACHENKHLWHEYYIDASQKVKRGPQEDRINSSCWCPLTIPCIWHQMENVNQGIKGLNQVRPKFIHVDILVIVLLCPAAAD